MGPTLHQLNLKQKLVLMTLGIIASVVFIELCSYVLIRSQWLLKTTSELSSTRWKLLWLKTHRSPATSTATDYPIDEFSPQLGWEPKKNSRSEFDKTIITFNSAGIRGTKEYALTKPTGWTRILVVGDSFSFGEEVNDEETFSAQLEKTSPNTEVLNFAVHGYGIDQMLQRFENQGLLYQPDIVIFAFISDDMNRAVVSFRDYQKPQFKLIGNALQLTNTKIVPPAELLKQASLTPATFDAANLLMERWQFRSGYNPEVSPLTMAIFARMYHLAQAHRVVPVFLFLPVGEEMTYNSNEPISGEIELQQFCTYQPQAICLSARPHLTKAAAEGVVYDTNRHYTPETHQIIMRGLLQDLQKLQLLPTLTTNDQKYP